MSQRQNIGSGSPWEEVVGYSRAVKKGNVIEIAGTTAIQDGKIIGINDPYAQTIFILQKIDKVLRDLGYSMSDVVRTRMYVIDISQWEEIGRAHGEFFRDIRPAATMVEVRSLIEKDMLVEIEVTAIV